MIEISTPACRYSASFATRFSRFLYSLCTPQTRIAFLSCPTAYIGFQHENPLPDAWLWEYDTRFKLVAGDKFVHYNLEEPEQYPEELRGTVDIAIADPPFLNEVRFTRLYLPDCFGVLTTPLCRSRTATLQRPSDRSSSPTANSSSSLRLPSRPSCPQCTRNRRSDLCDGRPWKWNTPADGYRTTLLAGQAGTSKTRTGSDRFLSGRRRGQSRDEPLHTHRARN